MIVLICLRQVPPVFPDGPAQLLEATEASLELAVEDWLRCIELEDFATALHGLGYVSMSYLREADDTDIDQAVAELGMKRPQAK